MSLHRSDHSRFGLPAGARFFFEEDNGGNATGGTGGQGEPSGGSLSDFAPDPDGQPITPAPNQERVEGEKLPDFSALGKKKAADAPPAAGGDKPPEKPEKPAGGQPDAKAAPSKPEPKAPEKPAAEKPPAKPAEPKAKPPEKPPEKPAAEKPPEKPAAEKPGDEKKLPEIPKDDKDLDAIQAKPNVPANVAKSIADIRGIAKTERATARAYQAELETVRAELATAKASTGKLPPEVEQELEGLRKFNLLFQAENDPAFKKEFGAKIEAAETTIFGLLEKHGLAAKIIDEIKAAGKAAGGDIEAWPRWAELVSAFKNPIDQQEVIAAIKSRRDAIGAKQTRLAELGQSKEKFLEAYAERQNGEQMAFSKGIEQASIQLAAANDWILEQEIPANADEAQRGILEARNAEVKKRAEAFGENVRVAYSRDPEKTAEVALKAVEADYLRDVNAELTTERDKATARVAELERQLAKIKSAGRMAHVESPSGKPDPAAKSTVEEGKVGGDGASAIRSFFAKK